MTNEKDLSKYRLEQAERCLKSAKTLFADGDFKGAANRSYYCVFHCMRSLLALEGKDFSKHTGVISHFRKTYIKTNIFDTKLSAILDDLFGIRSESDYDDFYMICEEEITEQIENADFFLSCISEYLENNNRLK